MRARSSRVRTSPIVSRCGAPPRSSSAAVCVTKRGASTCSCHAPARSFLRELATRTRSLGACPGPLQRRSTPRRSAAAGPSTTSTSCSTSTSGGGTIAASTRNSTTCGAPVSAAASTSCGPTRPPSGKISSATHGPGSSHTSDDTAERDHGSSIASPGAPSRGATRRRSGVVPPGATTTEKRTVPAFLRASCSISSACGSPG